ncbi:MAG: hypothetical protein R3Y57_02430 [Erysipelotrichaceae bacterium]
MNPFIRNSTALALSSLNNIFLMIEKNTCFKAYTTKSKIDEYIYKTFLLIQELKVNHHFKTKVGIKSITNTG